MGSVMMRVVSAARGGGAGAGCAGGRQAAGKGGKRPAGSMAGAGGRRRLRGADGGGGGCRSSAVPHARGPTAAAAAPGIPPALSMGALTSPEEPRPRAAPTLPLKRPPLGKR